MLLIVVLVVLLVLNALFVAVEFALVRAQRTSIEAHATAGRRGARIAVHQHEHMNRYLSAAQVGITLCSIGIGFVGEPTLGHYFSHALGGVLGAATASVVAVGLSFLVVTALHITVGEQVPKVYAIQNADRTLLRTSPPLEVFYRLLKPLIWALEHASAVILRALRVPALGTQAIGPAELQALIAQGADTGGLEASEAHMLSGVFAFHECTVRDVMTPWGDVATIDPGMTHGEALSVVKRSGHSRLPVCRSDEHVVGTCWVGDLIGSPDGLVGEDHDEMVVVPAGKPVDELLGEMRARNRSMALVVDEYGRSMGLATIEDVIEQIVGDILDETDVADVEVVDDGWLVRGSTPLVHLSDHGIELRGDGVTSSIGGLLFSHAGRLPEVGYEAIIDGWRLRVDDVEQMRVARVHVRADPDDAALRVP